MRSGWGQGEEEGGCICFFVFVMGFAKGERESECIVCLWHGYLTRVKRKVG